MAPADPTPSPPRRERPAGPRHARRSPGAIVASVVVHAGLVLLFAQAIGVTRPLTALFTAPRPVAEAVTYVEPRRLPPAPEPEGGGDGRPAASAPRVVAPVATPDAIPAPEPDARPVAEPTAAPALPPSTDGAAGRGTGSGTGVGALTGPAAGLRPSYTGSVVWTRPCLAHECPTTYAERLDSVVAGDLAAVRDSMVRAAGARRPGDWTFERDGQKWGMDEQYIRLGKISIPTAVLGALNFGGAQANPTAMQRQRVLEPMYAESREQGMRRQREATFDDVVRSIRERKDRERAARRAVRTASRDTTRRAP